MGKLEKMEHQAGQDVIIGQRPLPSASGNWRSFRVAFALWIAFLPCLAGASPFEPVLCRAVLDKPEVAPGNDIGVTLTMYNAGDSPAQAPIVAAITVRKKGAAQPLFTVDIEPWPLATMWRHNETVEFGGPAFLALTTEPGEYEVVAALRDKTSGAAVPIRTQSARKKTDAVNIGTLKVLASGSPSSAKAPQLTEFSPIPESAAAPPAGPSGETIALETPSARVLLDRQRPMIRQIGRGETGVLNGPRSENFPAFRFYRKKDGAWLSSLDSPAVKVSYSVSVDPTRVTYTAEVSSSGEKAFQCDLVFSLADNELRVGFQNLREQPGFLLTAITWPRILEARGNDARMVTGYRSGRLVDPNRCVPITLTHENSWIFPYPGGLVYTGGTLAAVTLVSPADTIVSSVGRDGGVVSAGFGTDFSVRATAPGPWERWLSEGGSSFIRIRILEKPEDRKTPLVWMDGARMLRDAVEVQSMIPPPFYQNTVLYKILMDIKGYPGLPPGKPVTDINQAAEFVRQIQTLTDGYRQVVYLTGAQHEGQDSKYPDVFTMNKDVGTYEDLVKFMRSGESWGATISFHSSMNEVYRDSPMWNEDIVCRDINGNFMPYGNYAGGTGYWINYDRWVNHGLQGFLDRLLFMYPISKTYHLDVMSTRPSNGDFNPEHPCNSMGGYLGRLKEVASFNLRGLDLTSEGFISWFAGRIGHAFLLRCDPYPSVIGDEEVPFVPFVYHGHATYGMPSELNPLIGILYGATFALDLYGIDPMPFHWKGNTLLDSLYLMNFPYQMLRQREIQDYTRAGDVRRVTYDADTYVEIEVPQSDFAPFGGYQKDAMGSFKVVIDGREIAKDFTAFVPSPRGDGGFLAYSKLGGSVTYAAPEGWNETATLKVTPLLEDAQQPPSQVEAKVSDGKITLTLPAAYPVRVSPK